MSGESVTGESSIGDTSSGTTARALQAQKPQRVLACVLCQQRKVKCDRKFPCANCVRGGSQCVPAALIRRPRKRRFPERELLDRLQRYEDLLRQNNVNFEPMHKNASDGQSLTRVETLGDSDDDHPKATGSDWSSASATIKPEKPYEAKYCYLIKDFYVYIANQVREFWNTVKQVVWLVLCVFPF